jgi:hypothetical protein
LTWLGATGYTHLYGPGIAAALLLEHLHDAMEATAPP